jgi:DNA-binding MarR family transcriptional regulator
MNDNIRQLYGTLTDLAALMNQPQRDSALLREAGVNLDRALFQLIISIHRKGPIGVVDLANQTGRDYTTVSRQVAKLESLGLIVRRPSAVDKRVSEAIITELGQEMTARIDAARDRIANKLFAEWDEKDIQDLVRLLRRFTDEFAALPSLEQP